MKKQLIILSLFFWGTMNVFAQKEPDMGLYKIRINAGDKNIVAEIKSVHSAPTIETDRFYDWYGSNKINETQGGYSGTLLNGLYQEYYLNKNLKRQGMFDTGLKTGIWKEWTEDGLLVQNMTWKRGIKEGVYELYDEKGSLKQKGRYQNNEMDGKQYTYQHEGAVEVMNYRHGKPVAKVNKSHFWQRIHLFKKRNKINANPKSGV